MMTPRSRRTVLQVVAAFGMASLLVAASAQAQTAAGDWPSRPIRLVTPWPAGGNSDNLARLIAKGAAPILGQPIVVENRPGASGAIGIAGVVKSPGDGYTLLFTTSSITVDRSLRPSLPYKADTDLVPITKFVSAPLVLLVSPLMKATTMREFVDQAKAAPKPMLYVTYGVGATNHLVTELFKQQTGTPMEAVPFKAMADALPSFIENQVQANFEILALASPLAAAGKVRILAIAGPTRDPNAPSVPTMAESGFPEFDASIWFGLFAPLGTPPAVVDKVQAAVAKILQDPELKTRLREMSLQGGGNSPADFAAEFARDSAKWRTVITRAGIVIKD